MISKFRPDVGGHEENEWGWAGGGGGRGGEKKWLHQTGGHSKLGRFYFLLYSNDDINITTSRSFV